MHLRAVSVLSLGSVLLAACVGDAPAPVSADGGLPEASPTADAGTGDGGNGDGSVVDTQNDPNNCGTVGHVCPSKKCTAGDCVRRVFVTSTATSGAIAKNGMNGTQSADALCASLAQAATLSGKYFAWISTATSSPTTHFTQGRAPYVLVDGTTVVADDFGALTAVTPQTPLKHGITTDENGTAVSFVDVWTQTTATGVVVSAGGCSNFESATQGTSATVGTSGLGDANWTMAGTKDCSTSNHLYCVEQ